MANTFGVPKELKEGETRVALTPDTVNMLTNEDTSVIIEEGAGLLSGFSDEEYINAGAKIVKTNKEVWANADYIIKVKEPQKQEYELFREDQVIFSYLHLAVEEELTKNLLKKKVCAISAESVKTPNNELPILRPMSEVAGRMSIQMGASYLEKQKGGSGVLIGGVSGVQPGKVVVIGGGVVGINAAKTASGMGADVSVLDVDSKRLANIDLMFQGRVKTHYSNKTTILEESKKADILVGAVLIPNKKPPKLITQDVVRQMKKGSVIIDVAIDQGGMTETADIVSTLQNPVYERFGVLHIAIPNLPSATPKTSSLAYSYAILPYVKILSELGTISAIKECEPLRLGVSTMKAQVTNEALAQSFGLEHTEISLIVGFNVR